MTSEIKKHLACAGWLLASLAILMGFTAWAQEITGTVTGVVQDQSGGVIPGAEVHVRNMGTNLDTKALTDTNGVYVVNLLPIGRYEVSAEIPGFKKFVQSDIELHTNDRLRVDITLQPGQVTETITVVGGQQVVQTDSSEISTLINGTQVTEMPLNGRNLVQLVALQPGVSSALPSTLTVGLGNLTLVYVNGNRASQNNWLLDGADNNDVGSNLALINYVNVDSVNEVKILRSNYSAEFGRSAGGQVSVVTKSGTNEFHGSVYEFLRNDVFDARNAFSFLSRRPGEKASPAPLRYNNFGWTVGGPVIKNRLFFFWGEEFRRIRTVRGSGVSSTRVPTTQQRAGNFSGLPTIIDPLTGNPFPGNMIPPERIDPLARALADRFPLPNVAPGVLQGSQNFSAAAPGIRNFREELVRVDYKISDAHNIYGRFIHDAIPSTEPFGEIFGSNNAAFPGISNTATNNPGRSFVGNWTWLATPTTINELSYQYSRGAIFSRITGNAARNVSVPKVFSGTPGDALLPGISFGSGGYGGWDFFGPYNNTYGSHRIKDTLSKTIGPHSWKFGFLYSYEFKNENAAGGTNGSFTFPGTTIPGVYLSTGDAFADFLLGRASAYSETNIDITSHLRFQMWEAFAQDDWKVRPNLTLNLGVRWSYILQPTDTKNILTNFDPSRFDRSRAYQIANDNTRVPGTGDPLNGIVIADQNSPFSRRVVDSHADTFGPRFGFAWDPTKDGKTAIRGGYGIYFDRTLVGIALQNAFVNPPFSFAAVFNAAGTAVPTLQNPQAGAQRNNDALVPGLIAMSPDFKIPTVQQWSLSVQRELPYQFNLEAAYVGTHGTHLLKPVGLNQTPPGTPTPFNRFRPFPGYGNISLRATATSSRYDSLQLSVGRRWARGVQFNAAYTLSKAIADSSSDRNLIDFPQDYNNQRAERALTSFDRRHIFVANYVWELPFFRNSNRWLYNVLGGWEISGITRFDSGIPLTITTPTNSARSFGGGLLRPNLVGNPEGPKRVDQWFNRDAFVQPPPDTFGNAGKGIVRGPGLNLTDLSIMKNFRVTEQLRLQYRAEMFNVFNHTNLLDVGTSLGTPAFGRVLTAREPRLIQMGLKLIF